MISAQEIYTDIVRIFNSKVPDIEKYKELYQILCRICSHESLKLGTDFSGLFSRLYAICQHANIEYHSIDLFRRHARQIINNKSDDYSEKNELQADCTRLCLFIAKLYNAIPPSCFSDIKETTTRPKKISAHQKSMVKIRAIVTDLEQSGFYCTSEIGDLHVSIPNLKRTLHVLHTGTPINILNLRFNDAPKHCTADLIIIDPDYLIDVSTLTACMKPYGDSAVSYFLDMISPKETTIPILHGNAANKFMDDLVNTPINLKNKDATENLYIKSLHAHFTENLLNYSCLGLPINKDYFDKLKETFYHIKNAVENQFPSAEVGLPLEGTLLEPSFICETLGLRGRLDVMEANHTSLVELKSGKAEENYGRLRGPRRPHILQMSLYKEMLHYIFSMPRDRIKSFLFYSKYPAFYNQRTSFQAITEALELRNEIVAMEAELRAGEIDNIIKELSLESLNKTNISVPLWNKFIKPKLDSIIRPLQNMSLIEHDYFSEFTTFLEREKFLSKTTDNRPDSNRGLASTWNTDINTKLASGDILPGIKIKELSGEDGVESIKFSIPHFGNDFIANFAIGEMVQLYQRNSEKDTVTTSQLIRGYIEYLNDEELTLRLAYKQRNCSIFPLSATYAIEHDGSDAPFTSAMRGLFSLLEAEESRRTLLLGQRAPRVALHSVATRGNWENTKTAEIVQKAKNAEDYFLLVGPPGTGKTSVALRAMVEEFLLEKKHGETECGLMAMAYTNRAVDEICAMLNSIHAPYVRIGGEQTCAKPYQDKLVCKQFENITNRNEAVRKLQEIPIVVGTVSTLNNHLELFSLRSYHAIIDEASQVLEPQILGLLCAKDSEGKSAIRKFIMIGDHKQLPAVVLLQPEQTKVKSKLLQDIGLTDLRNSLFQRLHTLAIANHQENVIGLLNRQGRMHPDICNFVNNAFYKGLLEAVPLKHQVTTLPLCHSKDKLSNLVYSQRMGFINVQPSQLPHNAKANADEASIVAQIVLRLIENNPDTTVPIGQRIGIIVPFRNQISVIRNTMKSQGIDPGNDNITIDTVECFQGSQRDFIIFSTTISRPYQLEILSVPTEIEGQMIDRKLNVAITRARLQFFMVGNKKILSKSPIYEELINHMETI